jgi:site-specific DNA-adenine methylase
MCVSYVGGKSKIAPQLIIPNISKNIETFVEPFSGQITQILKLWFITILIH